MTQLSNSSLFKLSIALTLYLTSLIAANTLGLKLMPFSFGSLSVSIFYFPVVFLMTDIVGEVFGKKIARMFVLAGFVSTFLFIVYTFISLFAPWAPNSLWLQDGYNQVFGITVRISVASLVAFIVGEYQDVITFFFLKRRLGKKHFWLRSNLSNLWSQFLDSVLFMSIAFLGVYPIQTLISITISWWLYKVVMGFLYTPLSYLGVYLLRDKTENAA